MVNPVLAHMGGIDEIGIFLVPALLAIYALRRAERQARKRAEAAAGATSDYGAAGDYDLSVAGDDATGTAAVLPPA